MPTTSRLVAPVAQTCISLRASQLAKPSWPRVVLTTGVCLLATVAGLCGDRQLHAADNPVEALPADAAVVVRLAEPKATVQKAVNYVAKVNSQYAPFVQFASAGLGNIISNPSQTGVDSKRDWWIAMYTNGERPPIPLFAVPVTDADQFEAAVVMKASFIVYEDWVLFTRNENLAEKVRQRIAGEGKSITTVASQPSRSMFANADLAVFVNLTHIKQTYATQIEFAKQQVVEQLQQLEAFAPELEGIELGPIFEVYGELALKAFEFVEDSESGTVTFRFDEDLLIIEELYRVEADSTSDQRLQAHTPGDWSAAGRLPVGQMMYGAVHVNVPKMINLATRFWKAMASGEDYEAFLKAMQKLTSFEYGGYFGSFELGSSEDGAVQATIVTEVKGTGNIREIMVEVTESMNMRLAGIEQEVDFKPGAETAAGESIDVLRVKQSVPESLDPLGVQNEMMRLFYGEDGMVSRMAYPAGASVQVIGNDPQGMNHSLSRWKSEDAQPGPGYQRIRSELPEKANVVILLDISRLAVSIMNLVVEQGQLPVPFNKDTLKTLEFEPSYIGITGATEPQGIRFRAVIPAAQIKGLDKIFSTVRDAAAERPDF